jgi:ribonuclease J
MKFDIKKHKKDLLFLPLGGSGEIGMNLNLYHYHGKWLMVDLGIGFADDYMPGIDIIVPNPEGFLPYKDDLIGLVITHAHEDHLGAVQYLWELFKMPIYTTKFTANFLRSKLSEYPFAKDVKITEVEPNSSFKIQDFDIELVQLNHSIPEMNALIIRTDQGNIVHTGDWKFDANPVMGVTDEYTRLKEIGDEGVLAMVCDSTNVFSKGHSGSEGDLRESLKNIVAKQKKLVVIATFASNVARLDTIIRAAQEANRKVVICGRSIERAISVARQSGYLMDVEPFLDRRKVKNYQRHELLILSTGCQGELNAALNKIAHNDHPNVTLMPSDTVIFSSKIIPGNDKKIFALFNQLARKSINVMTERDHFVHVSGHPNRDELIRMYELIKPQIAIPVHGETAHIHEHASLAEELGVKQAARVSDGVCLKIHKDGFEKAGEIKSGYLGVDGNSLVEPDSDIMKERRRIADSGVVFINIIFDLDGEFVTKPTVTAPGILSEKDDEEILDYLEDELERTLPEPMAAGKKRQDQAFTTGNVEMAARKLAQKFFRENLRKEPLVEVMIQVVN